MVRWQRANLLKYAVFAFERHCCGGLESGESVECIVGLLRPCTCPATRVQARLKQEVAAILARKLHPKSIVAVHQIWAEIVELETSRERELQGATHHKGNDMLKTGTRGYSMFAFELFPAQSCRPGLSRKLRDVPGYSMFSENIPHARQNTPAERYPLTPHAGEPDCQPPNLEN